tara:strand:+ start:266 stop:1693 length:1428 start_codon:yes stop_codon:yes gene_type:complete
MPIFTVGAAGTTSSSYEIANSLRFDSASSDNIVRTNGSTSNRRTYTVSFWLKKTDTTTEQNPVFAGDLSGANPYFDFRFDNTQIINWYHSDSGGSKEFNLKTNAVFKDSSAWYHFVLAIDTTQATDSNRVKLYVNGSQITSFSEATYPAQNFDTAFNVSGYEVQFGKIRNNSPTLNGYIAEAVLVDGQQLDPTSFGELDSNTNIWKPIDVSGLTFGTNGFYLDFENSGSLGADVSGNGNNFTVNNLTSVDQSVDTPTNNYNVLNVNTQRAGGTIGEGGLKYTAATSDSSIFGTIGIPPGMKVYFEAKLVNNTAQNAIGIHNLYDGGDGAFVKGGDETGTYSYKVRGAASYTQYFNNGSSTTTSIGNYANDTIIGVAIDNENGQIHYHANGTYINSSDPTDNNPAALVTGFGGSSEQYLHFSLDTTTSQPIVQYNFGSPPYTISSGNSDANGHGNFEYAVPSGYYALNTKNLAEFG